MDKITHYVATVQCNTSYCQPANLIPHFWYYKIVDKGGSPDLPCIMILSEIFGWFHSLSKAKTYYSTGKSLPELVNGQLAISYDFLSRKLNFQKERIRRKFVRLETLGILSRDVRNIALEDGSRIKQLYISIEPEFFNSCFRDPELDIRVRETEFADSNSDAFEQSPQFSGEHISNKNKNRSIISNFCEGDLDDQKLNNINSVDSEDVEISINENNNCYNQEEGRDDNQTVQPANNNSFQTRIPRKLEDFYPLTKEDCSALQSHSGREFSLNAMNEILKDISKKLSNRFFYSKKGFLAYMSKIFQYEMRDAVVVSNENFKIRANQDTSEQTFQDQEKYLTELEYSLQVGPEWHLKKKLASVLERSKAYNLLTSYKQLEIEEGGICKLILNKHVELSENDKKIILSQLRATHERIGDDGSYIPIETIAFVMLEKLENVVLKTTEAKNSKLPKGIWGKIRSVLIEYNGASGEAIDNHWISKLDADIDDERKRIKLSAPSDFIKDWVQNNYQQTIDLLARKSGFELENLSC